VAALCGLSPHPAAAQETTSGNVLHMDFNKRADGHNEDLHFYGKLQTLTSNTATAAATVCTFHEPDTRFEWPTAAAGITVQSSAYQSGKPFTYTYSNLTKNTDYAAATNYAGVKCIENDQLKLELNYMWALAKNYTSSKLYQTNFTSQIRITETEGGLYLYPGVTFKITTKNGKKIKKITLKTPYTSTYFTPDRRKAALFVYKTPEEDNFSSSTSVNSYNNGAQYTRTATVTDGTYEFNNGDNTIKRATIEITLPENYPGENADIVLGLKKDGLYPWNHTGTGSYKFTAITASSSSSSNINKLREPFGISAIDIEYYGDDELPKYIRTVTCGIDNNDIVEVEQNGSFVDITALTDLTVKEENREKIKISDATVKLRIGDAIVEITKSTTNNTSKPTVTFDKAINRIGVH
ncbi:MAG: hypothetical protein K2G82_06870, partial [Paramuribaculum sp.]|nr:hypothetical protein [Paramuribaculum sp.]